jgi:hypothetical protein
MESGDLVSRFRSVDLSGVPDFVSLRTHLERVLWVLLVAKDKLQVKMLAAEEIATIFREVEEIGINAVIIRNALIQAVRMRQVYAHRENGRVYYEIMKPGRDRLLSPIKREAERKTPTQTDTEKNPVEVYYFEPEKKFSSKRRLVNEILKGLKGDLRIVDPYCGKRTLDILGNLQGRSVHFLTRIENIKNEKERKELLRDLNDFKSEYKTIEFRNHLDKDIHDRYIISEDSLVLLGHGLNDLGGKESFAIVLDKIESMNVVEAVEENFAIRWNKAIPL